MRPGGYEAAAVTYVLAAVAYYLGAWATLTEPLHRRYPARLWRFMSCAACTGFWWSALLALALGRLAGWPFLWMGNAWSSGLLAGIMGIFVVPVLAWLHAHVLTTQRFHHPAGGDHLISVRDVPKDDEADPTEATGNGKAA